MVITGDKEMRRSWAIAVIVLSIVAIPAIHFQDTGGMANAHQFSKTRQTSYCPTPQYPSFTRGNPSYSQVPQRYLPGRCQPGYSYGCVPFVPQMPTPFYLGPSLVTETINSIDFTSVGTGSTTGSATSAKNRVESLLPTLTNDREIPDTTKTSDTDLSSVLDSVFNPPDSKGQNSGAVCKQAAKLCKEGKFNEALAAMAQESNSNQNYKCLHVHSNCNLGLGKLDDALNDIKQSQKLNPDFAPGYFTEGSILSEQNRLQDAVQAYSKAITLNPSYVSGLNARAGVYYRLSQFVDAVRDYERVLVLAPKDTNALYMRGLCYFMVGQFQIVPICFNEYLALNPNDAAALTNRASALFELGRYDDAIADFSRVLTIEPRYTSCLYRRCLAYWHLGRWQPARADAQKALLLAGWHDDNSGYLALCSYLLAIKLKDEVTASRVLEDAINNLDSKQWPYPLLLFYSGKITQQNLLLMPATKEQLTQARTYIAVKMAWSKPEQKSDAVALLELVRAQGASVVPEYDLAVSELFRNRVKDIINVARPVKTRYALVIGISKFRDTAINLKFSDKDAEDFTKFLIETQGFPEANVKCLVNEEATRENILGALGETWLPRKVNKEDLVVVYFSTHGSPSVMDAKGVNYLLAHDTDKEVLYATGIPVQDLTRMVRDKVHADRVVVIMDACHSGAAKADDRLKISADSMANESGQVVICSSLPEEVSWESKQYRNSVFTRHLMNGLQSKGIKTSLGESFEYTRDRVQKEVWSDRKQTQTPVMKSTWAKTDLSISGTR
jgi:tetratricopeptide (TPR) repeat protein